MMRARDTGDALEDALCIVARHFTNPKDIVTFAALSTGIYHRIRRASQKQRWSVVVSPRAREAGIERWMSRWPGSVSTVTYKRSVLSPYFALPACPALTSLAFWFCRVHPSSLHTFPTTLTSLVLHQVDPGDDPGCLTPRINALSSLRSVSITCSADWGIAQFGPLHLSRLRHLELRNPHGTLAINGPVPTTVTTLALHAREVDIMANAPFPASLNHVDVRSRDAAFDVETYITHSLVSLRLESPGVVFPPDIPRLESFTCRCDCFYIGRLPDGLTRLDVNVHQCFVCEVISSTSLAHLARIPHRTLTQRGRQIDLLRYMDQDQETDAV